MTKFFFLKFVSSVKFPDGYASNIARCVNVDGGKFSGLKSHDCHMFMQRLLPVGNQHLLPEDVVKPIMLLSKFFSQLTAKTLGKTDINQLRHDIVQILCKFEMIFLLAFFTSMIHMMVHLPEEALLVGPVNYRWMYPIERLLGELKKTVHNRAKLEGSIIEAWVQYETLTFCGICRRATPLRATKMSNLIRSRKAVTTAQSSPPPAQPSSVVTTPALMDHLPVGPGGSEAPASSTSSVVQPVSARRRHRPSSTIDTTLTDATGASGS
ncbi:hypothetical protein L3X38_042546 [Prunus dulcis]|uniref:DUF4218 domain-containing protein n=1 Tax=Prunus dulcis TaxID=3755 RepID=A0AAD4YKE6_PRUDU|nr:hypothetical protein L3X38_042546 [Prunus dulcis]